MAAAMVTRTSTLNVENASFKHGIHAQRIIAQQLSDGSWGQFHSLSVQSGASLTTERALRRLQILGFTIDDAPIARSVHYMERILRGDLSFPDRREKSHNWDLYTSLIVAAWTRRFTADCDQANAEARQWRDILVAAFDHATGCATYDQDRYVAAYTKCFGLVPRGPRELDFVSFYPLSIVVGLCDPVTERSLVGRALRHASGIYYLYDARLDRPPDDFAGKRASRYLGAIEFLADFTQARTQLGFVSDWLCRWRDDAGRWDLGQAARDGVYLPLSDDWRTRERRTYDCTFRANRLLKRLATPA